MALAWNIFLVRLEKLLVPVLIYTDIAWLKTESSVNL